MLGQALRPILRRAPKGARSYKLEDKGPACMNDLPIPQGSWKEYYDKMQSKYHKQLAISIVTLVGTIVVGRTSGLLYFNYSPPKPIN